MHKRSDEALPDHFPHLTLMGSFDLRHDGRSIVIAPAGQRLMSLLVLSRRTVTREYVAEKLWPDSSGAQGARCLRSALWRLPKLSRPLVVATVGTLQVSGDLRTDLAVTEEVLRRAIRSAEPSARERPDEIPAPDLDPADQALRCDLLPEAWDEWVVIERERLHQMRLHALESLARVHRSEGRFGQALDAALRAVAGEPLRESAHRQVIETYVAEGNLSEAIRHFKELRDLLRVELGVEPSPSLRRIMANTVGAARADRDV